MLGSKRPLLGSRHKNFFRLVDTPPFQPSPTLPFRPLVICNVCFIKDKKTKRLKKKTSQQAKPRWSRDTEEEYFFETICELTHLNRLGSLSQKQAPVLRKIREAACSGSWCTSFWQNEVPLEKFYKNNHLVLPFISYKKGIPNLILIRWTQLISHEESKSLSRPQYWWTDWVESRTSLSFNPTLLYCYCLKPIITYLRIRMWVCAVERIYYTHFCHFEFGRGYDTFDPNKFSFLRN